MKVNNILCEAPEYTPGAFSEDPKVDKLIQNTINPNYGRGLDLVYEWVKTGHINRKQFIELVTYLTRQ